MRERERGRAAHVDARGPYSRPVLTALQCSFVEVIFIRPGRYLADYTLLAQPRAATERGDDPEERSDARAQYVEGLGEDDDEEEDEEEGDVVIWVQGLGSSVWCEGCGVEGSGFRVYGLWFTDYGLWFMFGV